jgi:hypothetical protein
LCSGFTVQERFGLDAGNVDENGRSHRPFDKEYDSERDDEGFSGYSKLASSCSDLLSREPPSPGLFDREFVIQELEDETRFIPTRLTESARQLQVYTAKDNALQDWNVQKPRGPRRAPVDQLMLVLGRALPIPGKPSSRKSTHFRCSWCCIIKPSFT